MKTAAIALFALGLTTGAASAAERFTDVDYLRAARCKGIATGLGGVDTAAVNNLLKREAGSRADYVRQKAEEEFNRGKRDARRDVLKPQLAAELSSACAGYMGATTNVAAGAANSPT